MAKTTTIRGSCRRPAPVLVALLALAALAACEGEDVWVGEVGGGLNLDVCAGQETDCDPNVDDETLTTPAVLRSCDGEIGPELVADFNLMIADASCPGSTPLSCQVTPQQLTIAPDGSAWILGQNQVHLDGNVGDSSLWLAHYDDEGKLLSVSDVAFNVGSVGHVADFTLDERGHAFVFVYEIDSGPNADSPLVERAWVTELSPSGRPVQGTGVLTGTGMGHVALTTDGQVVLAANAPKAARYGVLAKLTPQGERVWSQTNIRTSGPAVGYGVTGLATDSSDHALVLAERKKNARDSSSPDFDGSTFGLTRFDRVGNAVWDRAIDRPLGRVLLSADAEGNAVISAEIEPIDLGDSSYQPRAMVMHVRASGAADWAYAFGGAGYSVETAIDPNSGEVMFSGKDEVGPLHVGVISADGESCRRYALPLGPMLLSPDSLAVDGEGRLYYMTQYHFGRVRFPEE